MLPLFEADAIAEDHRAARFGDFVRRNFDLGFDIGDGLLCPSPELPRSFANAAFDIYRRSGGCSGRFPALTTRSSGSDTAGDA